MDGAAWIDDLLRKSPAHGVSDLVLEPQDNGGFDAVMRLDGVRESVGQCPAGAAATAVGRLKALAGLPGYIVDEPQDGRIDGTPFGLPGDLRLAVLPTVRGQRCAIRLPAIGTLPAPAELGLPPAVLDHLQATLAQPDGMCFITGPTGSGKTTTIHSLLRDLAARRPDRQILSIEDPVERRLPGIAQVEVRPAGRFDFVGALRSALRQDVDILVVGEIRDRDTAVAAVQAALSGHLVIATLHAVRAREVLPRLCDLGVDRRHLLALTRLILAQRLVRRRARDSATGYRGRQLVCDLLLADAGHRRDWHDADDPPLHSDMDEQALALIETGITDGEEVARVLGPTRPLTRTEDQANRGRSP